MANINSKIINLAMFWSRWYSKDCPKKKQSLSAVESQEQPSSFGATSEMTLSGFFLNAFEEEAELNSFESKIAGVLVIGIDSGAARSVVLAGEIPGYSVERESETGRVYTSATGERVFDQGKHQIMGTVDGKVRGLNMRVAQVKKSTTCVRLDVVSCSTSTQKTS